ncbi:MAG: HAMP domain-containing sensor histidine kinase [Myxococcota bacterium]|jgi:signal transduction histidine kinase
MGLRARLLLAFLVPTLLVLTIGGYLLYRASHNVLEDQLGASLSDVAAAVASQLKADRVLSITAEDAQGEGSRTYRSLVTQLTETKERVGVRRILVVDAEHRARLDVGGKLPPLAEATELLRDSLELGRVFEGQRAASQVLFEGTDGRLYKTGYAPLLQDGKVVGAVAVEGTAAFFGPLTGLRNAFVGLLLVTLLMLAAAAVLVAQGLTGPIDRLVESALRIGGGDLSTPVKGEQTREIGILARELEAMRQALESRDRQLKLMLGGVAHEVKNPLGGIELFGGLLDEELKAASPDLKEAQSHLTRIHRELDYLKRIVEDFLVFAREQKLQAAPLDAKALLDAAAAHLAGEAAGRQVTLSVDAAPGALHGDESLLTSALVNLVKNAVQVSKEGQAVTLTGRDEGARYVIEVKDDGPGIPADVLPRIFEPFFTTREKGTGLGLPLAKKLVEAHRGTLNVRSQPGRTVFTVTLPLGRSDA